MTENESRAEHVVRSILADGRLGTDAAQVWSWVAGVSRAETERWAWGPSGDAGPLVWAEDWDAVRSGRERLGE